MVKTKLNFFLSAVFFCNFVKSQITFSNFNWIDGSQTVGLQYGNYSVQNDNLFIIVNASSSERLKIQSTQVFKTGIYEWNTYIPQYTKGDITSVGSFLYYDDLHEFDWECGFGNANIRSQLNISNDLTKSVCYMTSQSVDGRNSYTVDSSVLVISGNSWYNLKIKIQTLKRKTVVLWYLNNVQVKRSVQSWSIFSINGFYAFCSLENLPFMGSGVDKSNLQRFNNATWSSFKFVKI